MALAEPHTIHFDIPGAGPHNIQLASSLPAIIDPVALEVGVGKSVSIGTANSFSLSDFVSLSLVGGGNLVLGGVKGQLSPVTVEAVAGMLIVQDDVGPLATLSASASGGVLRLANSQHVAAVRASSGGVVELSADHAHIVTRQLVLDRSSGAASALDLGNGALVVDYTGNANPSTQLVGYLRAGIGSGDWNGSGLRSVAAHLDPRGLTALGMIDNHGLAVYDHLNGIQFAKGGAGESLPNDAILVRWTYVADADLSGFVSDADRLALLSGIVKQGPVGDPKNVWEIGDFDYNGVVDGDDFTALFVAFYGQGAPLATSLVPVSLGVPTIDAALPEPATRNTPQSPATAEDDPPIVVSNARNGRVSTLGSEDSDRRQSSTTRVDDLWASESWLRQLQEEEFTGHATEFDLSYGNPSRSRRANRWGGLP